MPATSLCWMSQVGALAEITISQVLLKDTHITPSTSTTTTFKT